MKAGHPCIKYPDRLMGLVSGLYRWWSWYCGDGSVRALPQSDGESRNRAVVVGSDGGSVVNSPVSERSLDCNNCTMSNPWDTITLSLAISNFDNTEFDLEERVSYDTIMILIVIDWVRLEFYISWLQELLKDQYWTIKWANMQKFNQFLPDSSLMLTELLQTQ